MPKTRPKLNSSQGQAILCRLSLFVGFPKGYQIFHAPEPICNTRSHGRTHAECTMNFDEVVGEIV